ncbi:hypothetical protein BJ508DRAFT_315807 [Ascobolus immersus RN42]|uniref:Uncharacterized protein n=1 Tax=Ascobolus immersus RN42 TaxID=1160509 RepID=A0A3N4HFM7_ASCIM|nr:hypothetical protein BJ508DRAFT_315807 [Ascobolus immersus RN42]
MELVCSPTFRGVPSLAKQRWIRNPSQATPPSKLTTDPERALSPQLVRTILTKLAVSNHLSALTTAHSLHDLQHNSLRQRQQAFNSGCNYSEFGAFPTTWRTVIFSSNSVTKGRNPKEWNGNVLGAFAVTSSSEMGPNIRRYLRIRMMRFGRSATIATRSNYSQPAIPSPDSARHDLKAAGLRNNACHRPLAIGTKSRKNERRGAPGTLHSSTPASTTPRCNSNGMRVQQGASDACPKANRTQR